MIPKDQLKLLMGHRRLGSSTLENIYVSDHCLIDQSAFAAGGKSTAQLSSEQARAAAGRSYGLSAPEPPTSVTNNPSLVKALEHIQSLQATAMADHLIAAKIQRLAIDLLNKDNWEQHLSQAQIKLAKKSKICLPGEDCPT